FRARRLRRRHGRNRGGLNSGWSGCGGNSSGRRRLRSTSARSRGGVGACPRTGGNAQVNGGPRTDGQRTPIHIGQLLSADNVRHQQKDNFVGDLLLAFSREQILEYRDRG